MRQEMIYIRTICEEGSFSAAARKLYVSQPALSVAVRKVEESLGAPIFDRAAQPLTLTEAGEIYMRQVARIEEAERDAAAQIGDLIHLRRGRLYVGATQYFDSYILPPVLRRFCEAYPGVEVHLAEESSALLESSLRAGSVDVIFECRETFGEEFSYTPVFQDHILLAVPAPFAENRGLEDRALTWQMVSERRHLDPALPPAPLERFAAVPFLLLTEGNNLLERAGRMFAQAGASVNVRMSVEQMVTAYNLARAGVGATFASARLVQNTPAGELCYYRMGSPLASRQFYAVTRSGRYVPYAVRELIELMRQTYLRP